jgi:hypothetical protein
VLPIVGGHRSIVLVVLVVPAGVVVPWGGLMLRSVRHGRGGMHCRSCCVRLKAEGRPMAGYPAVWYCVSGWVMVVLCADLACCSLSFVSAGCTYKLFLVRSGESRLVFGSWMVCAVAGREFSEVCPVWW